MTNEATLNKLIEMHLSTMADAFRMQMNDPSMADISFDDRFGLLVDREYTNRKNNRLHRLIRKAAFDQPQANVNDINYQSGRKLNKKLIERLTTCEYIRETHNIIIAGATGTGNYVKSCVM